MYMKSPDHFKKIINFFNSPFLVLFEMVIIVIEMIFCLFRLPRMR